MSGREAARAIALDHLTLVDTMPPDLVTIAAETGYAAVSLFLRPRFFEGAEAMPALADDAAMRRETRRRLTGSGITVTCLEGLRVHDALDAGEVAAGLDVADEIGARRINTLIYDPEPSRAFDRLALLCDMAFKRGIGVLLEYTPLTQVATLAQAVALARRPAFAGLQIQLDTLHHARSGGGVAEVAECVAACPGLIAHVQVSDGPAAVADRRAYLREAIADRAIPGDGELPLKALLGCFGDDDVTISAEVPRREAAAAGATPRAIATQVASGLRSVLS